MREQVAIHNKKKKKGEADLDLNPFDEMWGKELDVKPMEYVRRGVWRTPVRPKYHLTD